MSQIALDGELIPLKNCRIDVKQDIADKDKSGSTSTTLSAEQGNKGKELTVNGLIPFTKQDVLTRLFELANAKDDSGNRAIYRIGADVARVAKIRQAKFFGSVSAPQHGNLLAWNVSFRLREYLSVPEVAEQRKEIATASTAQTTEKSTAVKAAETSAAAPPEVETSGFMKFLTNIENGLA